MEPQDVSRVISWRVFVRRMASPQQHRILWSLCPAPGSRPGRKLEIEIERGEGRAESRARQQIKGRRRERKSRKEKIIALPLTSLGPKERSGSSASMVHPLGNSANAANAANSANSAKYWTVMLPNG